MCFRKEEILIHKEKDKQSDSNIFAGRAWVTSFFSLRIFFREVRPVFVHKAEATLAHRARQSLHSEPRYAGMVNKRRNSCAYERINWFVATISSLLCVTVSLRMLELENI